MYFFDKDSMLERKAVGGLPIKVAFGEKIMVAFVTLEAGQSAPAHNHPHEQFGYVVSGELTVNVGDESQVLRAGDLYYVPSDVPHSVQVSPDGPVELMDIFSPPREEYK